jgi:hypothetical protein
MEFVLPSECWDQPWSRTTVQYRKGHLAGQLLPPLILFYFILLYSELCSNTTGHTRVGPSFRIPRKPTTRVGREICMAMTCGHTYLGPRIELIGHVHVACMPRVV